MEINISGLSKFLQKVATELDREGNGNEKIDQNEVSIFKATCAFMVRHFVASDFEYRSIFGNSAFDEWKQTQVCQPSDKKGSVSYEYTNKQGDIIRGSLDSTGLSVYTENSKGISGYYSDEMIMLPKDE